MSCCSLQQKSRVAGATCRVASSALSEILFSSSPRTLSVGPDVEMIHECANSACKKQFRYLHEGKLFTLRVQPGSSEQRWLWVCNDCLQRSFVLRHSKPIAGTDREIAKGLSAA